MYIFWVTFIYNATLKKHSPTFQQFEIPSAHFSLRKINNQTGEAYKSKIQNKTLESDRIAALTRVELKSRGRKTLTMNDSKYSNTPLANKFRSASAAAYYIHNSK